MSKIRIYNDKLCPMLWHNMQLDSNVRTSLLQTAKDFYEKTEFKAPIKDIYMMGSSANYNWTPDSDLDVHILIDFNQLQMPPDTAEQVAKTAGAAWNEVHNIHVKGHKVEMNIQPISDTKPHVTGIYSLVKNKWIRVPKQQFLNVNKVSIIANYNKLKGYIAHAIQTKDREFMKSVKEYIDAYRQYGLDTKGELSTENIVFKILRKRGIMPKLKDAITATYDAQMSVNEQWGSGVPGEDRLHIPGHRWQIRSKDAPKTPKMTDEVVEVEKIEEATKADIRQTAPPPRALYKGDVKLKMMTLDNLKSFSRKMKSVIDFCQQREDVEGVRKSIEIKKMVDAELNRRWAYVTKPVAEDQMAVQKPSIRTQTQPSDSDRINLYPPGVQDLGPIVQNIVKSVEKVLDKKNREGVQSFTVQYLNDLLDDIFSIEIPSMSKSEKTVIAVKDAIIQLLSIDYKIEGMQEEAFDPTSVGPNPAASEGQYDTTFYDDQNDKMRQMGK